MYTYQDIAFRVIEKTDLDLLRQLHNHQDTYLNLYNIDFVDEWNQQAWWEKLHTKKNDKRYVLCFSKEPDTIFGRIRIQNINPLHNNCELGLDIMPKYRKRGLAKKSYGMMLEFLFHHLNMHMVYLKVGDFNDQAKSLYEGLGFRETGRLPEFFFRYGKYNDYLIMSITVEQYRNEKNKRMEEKVE